MEPNPVLIRLFLKEINKSNAGNHPLNLTLKISLLRNPIKNLPCVTSKGVRKRDEMEKNLLGSLRDHPEGSRDGDTAGSSSGTNPAHKE